MEKLGRNNNEREDVGIGEVERVEKKKIGEKVRGVLTQLLGGEEAMRRRRLKKKIRKLGYFKDDSGEWESPGFKLDELYPEVAEMCEASLERYRRDFEENLGGLANKFFRDGDKKGGFKEKIVENIDEISLMSEKDWDDLNYLSSRYRPLNFGDNLYDEMFNNLKEGEESFLEGLEKNRKRRCLLGEIFSGTGKLSDDRKEFLYEHVVPVLIRSYRDRAEAPEFLNAISNYVRTTTIHRVQFRNVADAVEGVLRNGGEEYVGDFFELYLPFSDEEYKSGLTKDVVKKSKKNLLMTHYMRGHGLKKTSKEAFCTIFDLIEKGNTEVKGIGDDFSDSEDGTFGIEDYTVECFSIVSGPAEIDRLVRIHNTIPTTNFANREQNRQDAISMGSRIFDCRDFIHNEKPGAHELISALVGYYDAKDEEARAKKKEEIDVLKRKYRLERIVDDDVYDLERYDVEIKARNIKNVEVEENAAGVRRINLKKIEGKMKVIDVLRRMEKNTEPTPIVPPVTENEDLNEAMGMIDPIVDETTGEIKVSLAEIGKAIVEMNKMLEERQGKVGVFPSMIDAVVFLDRMAMLAIRGMDKKEWREAVFDPNFKEVVRFSQLTSSVSYDEKEFEEFYRKITRKVSEGVGDDGFDDDEIVEGYQELAKKILENVEKLGARYAQSEETRRFSGALWSGNLAHELIGMADK